MYFYATLNTHMANFNYKLIGLIKSMEEDEYREFNKFVSSTFYSKGRNFLPLLKAIRELKKDQLDSSASHDLYARLFPDKKFNNQTLRNRFSELFKLGEEYYIYKFLKDNPVEKDKILLQKYLSKKLYNLFEIRYNKTKSILKNTPESEKKFRDNSFLNSLNLSLLNNKKKLEKMYSQYFDHSTTITSIFLMDIFHFGIEYIQQDYAKRKYDFNIATEVLKNLNADSFIKKLSKSNSTEYKIVCMHYYLYKSFEKPEENEQYYFEARKIFRDYTSIFSEEYRVQLYTIMIYYCTLKQNAGHSNFQSELFKLYNEKLKQGLISDLRAEIFPVNSFRDYVLIGVVLNKFDWVEKFIRKYSKELPEEIRKSEVKISYSRLYDKKGMFEKSLEYLRDLRSTNYLHYTDASVLKLCAYYELGKIEEAFFEIDKFRHYIRNHIEIPKVHLEYNLNFINIFQKLLKVKIEPGNKNIDLIEIQLSKLKLVSRKLWLTGKISELKD